MISLLAAFGLRLAHPSITRYTAFQRDGVARVESFKEIYRPSHDRESALTPGQLNYYVSNFTAKFNLPHGVAAGDGHLGACLKIRSMTYPPQGSGTVKRSSSKRAITFSLLWQSFSCTLPPLSSR